MYSKASRTHERILASAGLSFRRQGLLGASVAALMNGAGLTVGGFYAHFRSKEALIAETLPQALTEAKEGLFQGLDQLSGAPFLAAVVARYLSAKHRDDVDGGCAMPAVLSEVARSGAEPRQALSAELERFVAEIVGRVGGARPAEVRARVLAAFAVCVGGLMLARAVSERAFSDEILKACREFAVANLNV